MMPTVRYLKNLAGTPAMLYRVYQHLQVQKAFIRKELIPYLQQTAKENDGSIRQQDLDKIKKYYGLVVPAFLGEAIAALRRKPLTNGERTTATYLAATTGLFDDFFEDTQLPDDYIKNLYSFPEIYTGQNDNERLANYLWRKALQGFNGKDLLIHYAGKVHAAQIASRLQKAPVADKENLQKIIFDKGGYSFLFYMALFYQKINPEDEALFYNVGALLQLENDLFDVYKDAQQGIHTLVTQPESIEALYDIYNNLWTQIQLNLAATSYPEQGKRAFERLLAALVSRGFVCLQMLAEREKQNHGHFRPADFTRKQLICDMEKPANLLRTLHHYARIA